VFGGISNRAFASGFSGTLLQYDEVTWKQTTASGDPRLDAISGSSLDNVFAVGIAGTMLRYTGTD
jgi:hypothetical protein